MGSRGHHPPMSDKPNPVDDLKEGLGLIFRAAKGAVDKFPTEKLEDVAKDAAKEVGRAFESIGNEIDKAFGKVSASPSSPPAQPHADGKAAPPAETEGKKDEPAKDARYDDGYAPDPPKGPRVG